MGRKEYYAIQSVLRKEGKPMLIEGRVFTLVLVIVFTAAILYLARELDSGKREVALARTPVFDAMDEAVGRAAEMGRPVHYTFGTGEMDASVFASFKILGYVVSKCAKMDVGMIVTLAWAEEFPMAEEIVKNAWRNEGKTDKCRPDFVRYLSRSFSYTTGIFAVMVRERPAANFAIGPFYNESLLIPTAGRRVGAMQIGRTAVTIQVPFLVATCDYTLVGEDMMVAGAYLSGTPLEIASVAAQDVAKCGAIILCILGCLLNLFGSQAISNLLSL
jgi:hypothetical protein